MSRIVIDLAVEIGIAVLRPVSSCSNWVVSGVVKERLWLRKL